MLWAIFSDVHSNLPALEAVLEAIAAEKPDRILCLGDLVGYGPHPREVMARVKSLSCPVVVGNHDLAAVGALDASCFNLFAQQAVEWTGKQLSARDREFLVGLPLTWRDGSVAAVHGTWEAPDRFLYLQTLEQATALLDRQPCFLGVSGHTHVPLAFLQKGADVSLSFSGEIDLRGVDRALVNVGSVGQPRDEDSRAGYVLYHQDRKSLEFRRVSYDIERVVDGIAVAGLPALLGERLRFGM